MFEKALNISVRQFKRIDGAWGLLDKTTGKWTGMVSSVINREAELISTSLTLYGPRTNVIDFLSPVSTKTLGFFIKGLFFKHGWFILYHLMLCSSAYVI